MKLETRPVRADEIEEFARITSITCVGRLGYWLDLGRECPEDTLCAFVDGKMTSVLTGLPLTMSFRGSNMPVIGLSGVGTLPIYRGRGYMRKLITNHFERLHEHGEQPMVLIYRTGQPILYQRYGFAIVTTHNVYNIEPRYLNLTPAESVPGTFREAGDDDFRLMEKLYESFRSERTGYLQRNPLLWKRAFPASTLNAGGLVKFIYEEESKPLGYLVYNYGRTPSLPIERVDRPTNPGYYVDLTLLDLVWLEASAYRAMWNLLSQMNIVGNILWRHVPPDDPLIYLLYEPEMLHVNSSYGMLARIVDVERVLTLGRYPVAGTLTFEVLDELCPWNHGCWQLETSATEATICRSNASPQLRMPIGTLAMIAFNQTSATEAARMG